MGEREQEGKRERKNDFIRMAGALLYLDRGAPIVKPIVLIAHSAFSSSIFRPSPPPALHKRPCTTTTTPPLLCAGMHRCTCAYFSVGAEKQCPRQSCPYATEQRALV